MFALLWHFLFCVHTILWICLYASKRVSRSLYDSCVVPSSMTVTGLLYGVLMLLYSASNRETLARNLPLYGVNMAFAVVLWVIAGVQYEWMSLKAVIKTLRKKHEFNEKEVMRVCWKRSIYGATLENIERLHANRSPLLGDSVPEGFSAFLLEWLERDRALQLDKDRHFFASLTQLHPEIIRLRR
jgi:hypothetical protein